jgi:hypothetical protein
MTTISIMYWVRVRSYSVGFLFTIRGSLVERILCLQDTKGWVNLFVSTPSNGRSRGLLTASGIDPYPSHPKIPPEKTFRSFWTQKKKGSYTSAFIPHSGREPWKKKVESHLPPEIETQRHGTLLKVPPPVLGKMSRWFGRNCNQRVSKAGVAL